MKLNRRQFGLSMFSALAMPKPTIILTSTQFYGAGSTAMAMLHNSFYGKLGMDGVTVYTKDYVSAYPVEILRKLAK